MSLNRVELSGTLTRDPEYKVLPSGAEVLGMQLAVNDSIWDAQERAQTVGTVFVQVDVWDAQARQLTEYLRRGDEVYVIGRLDQREIERRDGSKDRKTRVQALLVQVLRSRSARSERVEEARSGEPVF